MNLRFVTKKTVALALIITPLIHTCLAVKDILFLLPKISFVGDPASAQALYQSMLKKAIIISSGLLVDSVVGFSLLIKPMADTKLIHIVLGILVFIFSIFVFKASSFNQLFLQLPLTPLT